MKFKNLTPKLMKEHDRESYYLKYENNLYTVKGFYCLSENELNRTSVKIHKNLKSFIKYSWAKCFNSNASRFSFNVYALRSDIKNKRSESNYIGFFLHKRKNIWKLYNLNTGDKSLVAIIDSTTRKIEVVDENYSILIKEIEQYLPKKRKNVTMTKKSNTKNSIYKDFITQIKSYGIPYVSVQYITQKKLNELQHSIFNAMKNLKSELTSYPYTIKPVGFSFSKSKKFFGRLENEIIYISSVSVKADRVVFTMYHEYGHLLFDKLVERDVNLDFLDDLKLMDTLKTISANLSTKFNRYLYANTEIFARLFEQYMGEQYSPHLLDIMKHQKSKYWYFTKEEMQLFYKFLESIK